jgi:hypothetical protein
MKITRKKIAYPEKNRDVIVRVSPWAHRWLCIFASENTEALNGFDCKSGNSRKDSIDNLIKYYLLCEGLSPDPLKYRSKK